MGVLKEIGDSVNWEKFPVMNDCLNIFILNILAHCHENNFRKNNSKREVSI